MIDRRIVAGYDWILFVVVMLLLGIGVLSIYTVTASPTAIGKAPLYLKQIYWIILGWAVFLFMAWIDYREIVRFAYPIYAVTLLLLLLVLLVGRSAMGAQRWLSLGFISIQPSELAKVSLLLVSAKYFSDYYPEKGLDLKQLLLPGGLVLFPMLLILKQPDLGTAMAISSVFFSIVLVIGFRSRFLVYASLIFFMVFPFLWQFFWNRLRGYQRDRLRTFVDPTNDPMGTGYHIIQSKIAIGSGGVFGKGLFGGTQSQLKFLPESHTDFIFSVFAEEWGFIGIVVVFILFFLLVLWGLEIAYKARDLLGTLLAIGVIGLISFYFLINVGMTLGVMPVVGVPLPLMSYGGTSMVTTMGLLGLLFNVKLRRFMLF
ncbi:MAG: rod shape-determining protein RodA [Candidatus Manganitrophaceae bacterium]